MNFIKRHWFKLSLLIIFLVIIVVGIYAAIKLVYPDSRKDVYGNRLLGIEDVMIDEQDVKEIKEKINSSEFVLETDYVLKGRLINFTIYVSNGTDKNKAKEVTKHITEIFNTEIQEFYDMQVLIIEEEKENPENEEEKKYYTFGYKHKTSKNFVWIKN